MFRSRSQSLPAPYYQVVATHEDIILLRQQVRASARDLGLTLQQQAKLTTAIGSMAEAVRRECSQVTWMVRVILDRGRQVLDVACVVADKRLPTEAAWSDVLPLATVRHLVADTRVLNELGKVMISVREPLPVATHHTRLQARTLGL